MRFLLPFVVAVAALAASLSSSSAARLAAEERERLTTADGVVAFTESLSLTREPVTLAIMGISSFVSVVATLVREFHACRTAMMQDDGRAFTFSTREKARLASMKVVSILDSTVKDIDNRFFEVLSKIGLELLRLYDDRALLDVATATLTGSNNGVHSSRALDELKAASDDYGA